jgi:hypothetical protein
MEIQGFSEEVRLAPSPANFRTGWLSAPLPPSAAVPLKRGTITGR